jgi:hypothetical protein
VIGSRLLGTVARWSISSSTWCPGVIDPRSSEIGLSKPVQGNLTASRIKNVSGHRLLHQFPASLGKVEEMRKDARGKYHTELHLKVSVAKGARRQVLEELLAPQSRVMPPCANPARATHGDAGERSPMSPLLSLSAD